MKSLKKNVTILQIKALTFERLPGYHDWAGGRLSSQQEGLCFVALADDVPESDGRMSGLSSGGVDSKAKELVFYLAPFQC